VLAQQNDETCFNCLPKHLSQAKGKPQIPTISGKAEDQRPKDDPTRHSICSSKPMSQSTQGRRNCACKKKFRGERRRRGGGFSQWAPNFPFIFRGGELFPLRPRGGGSPPPAWQSIRYPATQLNQGLPRFRPRTSVQRGLLTREGHAAP